MRVIKQFTARFGTDKNIVYVADGIRGEILSFRKRFRYDTEVDLSLSEQFDGFRGRSVCDGNFDGRITPVEGFQMRQQVKLQRLNRSKKQWMNTRKAIFI